MPHRDCDWCDGTGLVTLYREGYDGDTNMIVEELDLRTGEIRSRRVPGRITVHCRQCPFGEGRWQQFKDEDRKGLWTTRHLLGDRPTYVQQHYRFEDPTYRETFATWQEGVDYLSKLGDITTTFPRVPTHTRATPEQVANQLRERAEKESAA